MSFASVHPDAPHPTQAPAASNHAALTRWPGAADIEAACRVVSSAFAPTPQYRWGQLERALGCETWLKHENHNPVGAFKIRGGLTYFDGLRQRGTLPQRVVSATRGNHGQSVAWAARTHGVGCTIVVPQGNSREKNAAMQALGAQLIEHGEDFQAAREHATQWAQTTGAHMVPSFHPDLVCGVSTLYWELLRAAPQLTHLYVPIGLGSGACAALAAKQALGHPVAIIGVVSAHALTYARSLAEGHVVPQAVSTELADGLAVRQADPDALAVLQSGLAGLLTVSDAQIAHAMRLLFAATHNVAEGAGAASLAAALAHAPARAPSARVGLVLSGGNVDSATFAQVLLDQGRALTARSEQRNTAVTTPPTHRPDGGGTQAALRKTHHLGPKKSA